VLPIIASRASPRTDDVVVTEFVFVFIVDRDRQMWVPLADGLQQFQPSSVYDTPCFTKYPLASFGNGFERHALEDTIHSVHQSIIGQIVKEKS
jgi:hypothetical protein